MGDEEGALTASQAGTTEQLHSARVPPGYSHASQSRGASSAFYERAKAISQNDERSEDILYEWKGTNNGVASVAQGLGHVPGDGQGQDQVAGGGDATRGSLRQPPPDEDGAQPPDEEEGPVDDATTNEECRAGHTGVTHTMAVGVGKPACTPTHSSLPAAAVVAEEARPAIGVGQNGPSTGPGIRVGFGCHPTSRPEDPAALVTFPEPEDGFAGFHEVGSLDDKDEDQVSI
jgi:hypothetical protein